MNVKRRCVRAARGAGLIVTLAAMLGQIPHAVAADTGPVTNVRVAARGDGTATLTFDVSWKGSWRHEGNHDAAWVFFKVRAADAEAWQHVRLAADRPLNPSGYGQADGTRVDLLVPDGEDGHVGMIVRRADYGIGDVAARGVTAVWDIAAARDVPRNLEVRIQPVAIEMVFVPEGPFDLGSDGNEPQHFYRFTDGLQHTAPYRVTDAGPIPTGRQAGKLWARRGNEPEDDGSLSAAFPNGYRAFYCMKGHVMREWDSFVNTLTPAEVDLVGPASPNKHGGLAWADGAAFASWAGLRPLTELEYEKLTRGPIEPGWDTGDSLNHPSFWGVSAINGWRSPRERVVTVANAAGRAFRGTHGRGTLNPPDDWPRRDAVGAGIRGGHGAAGNPSYRRDAAVIDPDRKPGYGWRGVRTAPRGVGL
ncbi:MAG: hypothetical protein ACK5SI_02045 [Planctomycetia bacterium]